MSESTLTAAITTQARAEVPAFDVGTIVVAQPGGGDARLAIVTGLPDDGTAQVILPGEPGSNDLIINLVPCQSLAAAPDELDTSEQMLARRLIRQLAADASDQAARLRSECARSQQGAAAASATIESMRAYAIGKHLDGTICLDGLNEFLAAHDLALYQPRHTAQVAITVDVEVEDADDSSEAASLIREHIEVSSADDDRVCIIREHDASITGLRPVPRA